MNFGESIKPVPYSPDLTPAEEHLRMSRVVGQVNDWLGHTPWSDSEAAERSYGWPAAPSARPSLGETLDQDDIDEHRHLGKSALIIAEQEEK